MWQNQVLLLQGVNVSLVQSLRSGRGINVLLLKVKTWPQRICWQIYPSFHVEESFLTQEKCLAAWVTFIYSHLSIWKLDGDIQANHPNWLYYKWGGWFVSSWSGSDESPYGGSCSSCLRDTHPKSVRWILPWYLRDIPGKCNSSLAPIFSQGEDW